MTVSNVSEQPLETEKAKTDDTLVPTSGRALRSSEELAQSETHRFFDRQGCKSSRGIKNIKTKTTQKQISCKSSQAIKHKSNKKTSHVQFKSGYKT